jgi:hypothetical protein
MANSPKNDIEIAVIKTEINGIREQQKVHALSTEKRFDNIDEKLDLIMQTRSFGKGVIATVATMSSLVGAYISHLFTKGGS